MSEYKDFIEQHQDNCEDCQEFAEISARYVKHMKEVESKADAQAQLAWDAERGK